MTRGAGGAAREPPTLPRGPQVLRGCTRLTVLRGDSRVLSGCARLTVLTGTPWVLRGYAQLSALHLQGARGVGCVVLKSDSRAWLHGVPHTLRVCCLDKGLC